MRSSEGRAGREAECRRSAAQGEGAPPIRSGQGKMAFHLHRFSAKLSRLRCAASLGGSGVFALRCSAQLGRMVKNCAAQAIHGAEGLVLLPVAIDLCPGAEIGAGLR